jgi:hypothetical protein
MATIRLLSFVIIIFVSLMSELAAAQAQTRPLDLQGEVKDQNGALVVGAKIGLTGASNFLRETTSDSAGRFRLSGLPEGSYTLQVEASGFNAEELAVELSSGRPLQRLNITLYPIVRETVNVGDDTTSAALDPESAAGTQILKEQAIAALPDDPDQLNEQLQQLAASSGSAPGQATVTVDGFLTGGRLPPKSAIREVRINPDLYSAEYDTPPYQGGRIEVYTKPGAGAFHGSGFFNFNDSRLNARDAFAPVRPHTNIRRYGLQLGGPISPQRAGFFLDFERRDINESEAVNAIILDANFLPSPFINNIATPKRLTIGSARADWQLNPSHTLVARVDFNLNRLSNQGAGAFDLPERAFHSNVTEQTVRVTETAVISPSMFNELRAGLTRQRTVQRAASDALTISVPGAFNAGGATAQAVTHNEWRVEIADNLSFTSKRHTLKFGAQLFGRIVKDERANNFNGTFLFGGSRAPQLDPQGQIVPGADGPVLVNISGLEQYRRTLLGLPGGVPTRFSLTRGDPSVAVNQWLAAGFVQDEWRWRPNLSLSLGLRYEGQTSPSDQASLAPRLGLAFSPDKQQHWVLRARAGIFYERIGEAVTLESLRLDGFRQQQIIIDAPAFPDPFTSATLNRAIPTVRRLDEALRPPASLQMRLELERQLPRGWKVSLSRSWASGWGLLRSRNINAPLVSAEFPDPLLAPRPFGLQENILQFESSGRLRGRVLSVFVNQPTNKRFNLHAGYLYFNFRTDTDNAFALPQSSYDLSGEWARPFWEIRHRLFLVGIVNLPRNLRAAVTLNAASGRPFNITTGRDNNGDGQFNDRPGIADASSPQAFITRFGALDPAAVNGTLPRNAGTNPRSATLDLNLSRTFKFGAQKGEADSPYQLTFNVRASNLLNRTNPLGLNGVLTSPFFGRANAAAPARRIELGLRFSF